MIKINTDIQIDDAGGQAGQPQSFLATCFQQGNFWRVAIFRCRLTHIQKKDTKSEIDLDSTDIVTGFL